MASDIAQDSSSREQTGWSNPEYVREIVGTNVWHFRNIIEMSQATLAKEIGMTRATISCVENYKQNLKVHTLAAIAKALGVSPGDLLIPWTDET